MRIRSIEAVDAKGNVWNWIYAASADMLERIKLQGDLIVTKINGIAVEPDAAALENMKKQETIAQFIFACYITIKCEMCGETRSDQDLDEDDIAEAVWIEGWRYQDERVLCQHCKDNQR